MKDMQRESEVEGMCNVGKKVRRILISECKMMSSQNCAHATEQNK